jgi:hypothetical protein
MNPEHPKFKKTLVDISLTEDEIRKFADSRVWLALVKMILEKSENLMDGVSSPNVTDRQSALMAGALDAYRQVIATMPRILVRTCPMKKATPEREEAEVQLRKQLAELIEGYFET